MLRYHGNFSSGQIFNKPCVRVFPPAPILASEWRRNELGVALNDGWGLLVNLGGSSIVKYNRLGPACNGRPQVTETG